MKISKAIRSLASGAILAGSFATLLPATVSAGGTEKVSVELFLSVDVSGSVDSNEYNLQKRGYIKAFQDQEVIDAIESLPDGLAVAIESWSNNITKSSDWYLINDADDIPAFISAIESTLNQSRGSGGTDVTKAIRSATKSIKENRYDGDALVIDVSGDGISKNTSVGAPNSSQYANYKTQVRNYLDSNGLQNLPNLIDKASYTLGAYSREFTNDGYSCSIGQDFNTARYWDRRRRRWRTYHDVNSIKWQAPIEHLYCPPLKEAVDYAESQEITINGLPINGNANTTNGKAWREAEISNYYQSHIITSDGFVETASGFNDFARAVKTKIKREITEVLEDPQPDAPTQPETPTSTNVAPTANEDSGRVGVTQTLVIDLLANDTDPDIATNSDFLSISEVEGLNVTSGSFVYLYKNGSSVTGSSQEDPNNIGKYIGKASVNEDGEFVFTAGTLFNMNPGYQFEYTVTDSQGASDTENVNIKVLPFSD